MTVTPEMIEEVRSFFAVEAEYFMPTGFAKRLIAKVQAMSQASPPPEAANEIERLREALEKIADRATAMRKGTDDWFELAEFEIFAREVLSLHKADRHG